MTIRLHYFQHVPFEGLGSIGSWAEKSGCRISATHFYDEPALPATDTFDWLVVMGGPMGVHDTALYPWLAWEKEIIYQAIDRGKVVLGICLGAQLIADALGATVFPNARPEIGWFPVQKTVAAGRSDLGAVFPDRFEALHWHGDTFALPEGAVHLARSQACENQGFIYAERVIALQFHLETRRADLVKLIDNCRDELNDGPYIQTPEQMLARDRPFAQGQTTLGRLLDKLSQR